MEFTGIYRTRIHEQSTNDSDTAQSEGYRCWGSGAAIETKLNLLLDTNRGVLAAHGTDGSPLLQPSDEFVVRGWRGLYGSSVQTFGFHKWNLT